MDMITRFGTILAGVISQARHSCCFKKYVVEYEEEKEKLSAMVNDIYQKIEEASRRNEAQITPEVRQWLDEANSFIQEDTNKPKKKSFYGLCSTNCVWQYMQGKKLDERTLKIKNLMASTGFPEFRTLRHKLSAIRFSSFDFINFESRKTVLRDLRDALKNDMYMIGLCGMGGTGKTTIARELGKQAEESKLFDKVIFIVVSCRPNVKKIQREIARQLGLTLEVEEDEEVENARKLCSRMVNGGEKVLMILDDVWEVINLEVIGIPNNHHHEAHCTILLTTRNLGVCRAMGCQKTLQLGVLSDEEAMDLFTKRVGKSTFDYTVVAFEIVKKCQGLPVAVVAVACALNLQDWMAASRELQDPESMDEIYGNLVRILRKSYDNLEGQGAKTMFLLCCMFSEDSEIPIELLSKCGIGLGLFGEVDKYDTARRQALTVKDQLIESSLLVEPNESECVKMHDLVRDVALRIAKEEIQVVMDSETTLKENTRYSSWIVDGLYNCFHGSKLELLLLRINVNAGFFQVPDALFKGVMNLRVLFLICENEWSRVPAPSLLQSIHSLTHIRTLLLANWELGDLSIMGSLQSLGTLELNNCSIIELPIEVRGLTRLRLLGLRNCVIERNNPFQVIERCLHLEELFYVENSDTFYRREKVEEPLITGLPPALTRYHIIGDPFSDSLKVSASTSTCFKPGYLREVFSEAAFKLLVAKAEILELGGYDETGWTSLIPGIFPTEDGGAEDLIRLHLYSWSGIEYLIHTENHRLDVTIFSKLLELKLSKMDVIGLCYGHRLPHDFFKALEIIELKECLKLESTLFKGGLHLDMLKSIKLENCSMTSLFTLFTAQSLKQLETLDICECHELVYLITESGEEIADYHQGKHGSMFPQLKFLHVESCENLPFILPIRFLEELGRVEGIRIVNCMKLRYVFDRYPDEVGLYQIPSKIILPSLEVMQVSEMPNFISIFPAQCYLPKPPIAENSSPSTRDDMKEKHDSPSHTFSWSHMCCFQSKPSATGVGDPSVSKGFEAEVYNTTWCLLKSPLDPGNIRKIKITGFSNLKSLFTLSIASTLRKLEKLEVGKCNELEHILTDDGDDDDGRRIYSSIFPNLREFFVWECVSLKYLFPEDHMISRGISRAKYFLDLGNMRKIIISHCPNLEWLFTLSIASSMHLLRILQVAECRCLVQILTGETDDHDHRNYSSIFPNLQEVSVWNCRNLESLFPASHFTTLDRLKSLRIHGANKLRYVLGKCYCDDNSSQSVEIPAGQPVQEISEDVTNKSKQEAAEEDEEEQYLAMQEQNSKSPTESTKAAASEKVEQVPISNQPTKATNSSNLHKSRAIRRQTSFLIKETAGTSVLLLGAPKSEKAIKANEVMILEQSKASPVPFVIPLQNEPPQDKLVDREAGNETIIMKEAASAETIPYTHSSAPQNDIGITVGEGILTEKENKAISSPQLEQETLYPDPFISTEEFHEKESMDDREAPEGSTSTNKVPGRFNKQLDKIQKVKEPSDEFSYKESLNKTAQAIPSKIVEKMDSVMNQVVTELEDTSSLKATREVDEKDSEIHDQNNSAPNLTEDLLVRKEADNEKIIMEEATIEKNEVSVREGPLLEKYQKATSSTHSEPMIAHPGPLTSTNEFCKRESMGDREALSDNTQEVKEPCDEHFSKARSNKTALAIPPTVIETRDSASNAVVTSSEDTSPLDQSMVNIIKTYTDKKIEVGHINPQIEDDDLITLFRITEEGADIRGRMPCVSETVAPKVDDNVAKAFSDVEILLKMNVSEVASSEENSLCLENALNFLSNHYSQDGGAPSQMLKAKIDSMHQEISIILSSFKQASAGLAAKGTVTKLEEKNKCIDEELPMQKEAALALVSEIHDIKKSMQEAQQKEAELIELISRLQDELNSKEKEIQEWKIKLSEKEKSVWNTIAFLEDYEATKEATMVAKQELDKVNVKWSSCEAKWLKTLLLQRIYLKQKLWS